MQRGLFSVEVPTDGFDDLARLGESLQALACSLETRFEELARLARITERLNESLVLEDVLDEVYESFRTVIPYDRLGLALLEKGDKVVRARWAHSEAVDIKLGKGFSLKLAETSLGRVMNSATPRILNELEAYLEDHPSSESTRLIVAEGIRSSLTCPLVALGKPIGFLFFASREKNTYREMHQGFFMQMANHISVVLEKSRLYEEMLDLNRRLQETQRTLEHEASHDSLTGLWNRRAVLRLLKQECARADRKGHPLAVIILDLDRFKPVNDEHGHLVGDEVLGELARRLTSSLRSDEFFGRLGGEEFLLILRPGDRASAEMVMERARRTCEEEPFSTTAGDLAITASLGAAVVENAGGFELADLLSAADRALYRAKAGGCNRSELELLDASGRQSELTILKQARTRHQRS
jgi:diguanylate cyclase (GGDEF)-like protein